jgi:hypothetical protein
MKAWKFLDTTGRSVFTKFQWSLPERGPGEWYETPLPVGLCVNGVHACRKQDLSYWLNVQLWEMELDGEIVESDHLIVASRARLIRRIEEWETVSAEFARWAVERSRNQAVHQLERDGFVAVANELKTCPTLDALGALASLIAGDANMTEADRRAARWVLDNVNDLPNPVAAANTSARVLADITATRDPSHPSHIAAFDAERHEQSAWLAARLGL